MSCSDPSTRVTKTPLERREQLREAPGCQAVRESCPAFFDTGAYEGFM